MSDSDVVDAIQNDIHDTRFSNAIETAQKAGRPALANRIYRQGIGEPEPGAEDGADAFGLPALPVDDAEPTDPGLLDAPAGAPDDVPSNAGMEGYEPWDTLSEAQQHYEFRRVMDRADPEMARRELRVSFPGAAYDREVRWGEAALQAIPGSAKVMRVLEAAGLADHPDLAKFIMAAGRMLARVAGDPNSIGSTTGTDPMASTPRQEQLARGIDQLQRAIDKAQARNDRATAQRLYLQQQRFYEALYGTQPAVGSSGGPTA